MKENFEWGSIEVSESNSLTSEQKRQRIMPEIKVTFNSLYGVVTCKHCPGVIRSYDTTCIHCGGKQ
ncbi:hypothetical protein VPHK392_0019 [Vibrio phage K392]